MLNRELGYDTRRQAMQQAADAPRDDDRYTRALRTLLWEPRYPHWQRQLALSELAALDPTGLRQDIERRLPTMEDWPLLTDTLKLAAQMNWTDLTPVIIQSYARTSKFTPDTQRPEHAALTTLYPNQTPAETAYELFVSDNPDIHPSRRHAAWQVLNRLEPTDNVATRLVNAPDTHPLITDLKAAHTDLGVLPETRYTTAWLTFLRTPDRRDDWNELAAASQQLSPEQRPGLEMRHLALLRHTSAQTFQRTHAELTKAIAASLAIRQHVDGAHANQEYTPAHPQRFEDWQDQLSWADLATIQTLLNLLTHQELIEELFRLADADLADTTTEYGGVLDLKDSRPVAIAYPPAMRRHDRIYYAPTEMIEHLYTAIAHYHFHAQQHNNGDHALPGLGDRDLADRLGLTCLVFTFVDRDQLNVDYYQSGGVSIDLSTISRTTTHRDPDAH